MTQTIPPRLHGPILLGWLSRTGCRLRLAGCTDWPPVVLTGPQAPRILDLLRAFDPAAAARAVVLDMDPVLMAGAALPDPASFAAGRACLAEQAEIACLGDLARRVMGDRAGPLARLRHPLDGGNLRALIAANDAPARALRDRLTAARAQVMDRMAPLRDAPRAVILGLGHDRTAEALLPALLPGLEVQAAYLALSLERTDPDRRGVIFTDAPGQPAPAGDPAPLLEDGPDLRAAIAHVAAHAGDAPWRIEDDLARALAALHAEAPALRDFFTSHERARGDPGGTVAIVTRTKDRPLLLARAARSVAEQSWRDFRWIVVNDGGDPAPVAAVIQASGVDPDRIIRIDNPESRGMEAASNMGVRAARTEFVAVHDDDDQWHPDFLRDSIAFLTSPRAAAAGFEGVLSRAWRVSERIEGGRVVIQGSEPFMPWVAEVPLAQMAVGNFFAPISFLYRRRVFDQVGGYDESLPVLGDWRFNLDFLARANIGFLDSHLSWYHHRDGAQGDVEYTNSVIGAQRLHREYFSVVTNGILRDPDTPEALRLVVATAHLQRVTERNFNGLRRRPEPRPEPQPESVPATAPRPGPLPATDHRHIRASLARALPYTASPRRIAARLRWDLRLMRLDDPAMRRRHLPRLLALIPSPDDFDHIAYLRQNPGIWATRFNGPDEWLPYHHYLLEGAAAGLPRPAPDDRAPQ